MRVIRSLCIAFSTYSRIPVPQVAWTDENRKYSMCFFPLIGAVIGLLLWGWLALCDVLGFEALPRGAVGALLPILVTGGIHIDGFMDTSDALASWQSPEKRLEILKDSHVGAFAVLGCAGYLLLDTALLSELPTTLAPMMIGCFMLSRACSAWAMSAFRSARPKGMLDAFAQAAQQRMLTISCGVHRSLRSAMGDCRRMGGDSVPVSRDSVRMVLSAHVVQAIRRHHRRPCGLVSANHRTHTDGSHCHRRKAIMKLYIGGVYQGQEELARAENPGLPCYPDFHEAIRRAVLEAHQDPREFARQFCAAHPDAIVVANEVGAGVVPIVKEERLFREAVGRALCIVAQESESVTRCVCGIEVRIK